MSEVLPPIVVTVPPPARDAESEDWLAEAKALNKKREKVRSAWISFVGRILAQLIGAVATVLLGFWVVTTYHNNERPAVVAAATVTEAPPLRAPRPGGRSMAVLPFQDFSPDAGQTYFVDGLTEALIARLARGGQVHVTSRTTSMHCKTSRDPLPVIARALNVDYVVEGSVVRQHDRVRVTVQLIDARSDDHLWAETFDRADRDLLALQADVSEAIATRLQAAIPPAGEARRP
jgi:TolB-like protein